MVLVGCTLSLSRRVIQEVRGLRVLIRNPSNKSRNRKVCLCGKLIEGRESLSIDIPHCHWHSLGYSLLVATAVAAAASMSPNNFTIFALQAYTERRDESTTICKFFTAGLMSKINGLQCTDTSRVVETLFAHTRVPLVLVFSQFESLSRSI